MMDSQSAAGEVLTSMEPANLGKSITQPGREVPEMERAQVARPSDYTEEIAEEICNRIAAGESVKAICADKEGGWLPGERTVYRWLDEHESFRQMYARAREAQADGKFEKAWDIANSATVENVQVARLQVDTIKWQAAKLAPRKYGDSVKIDGSLGVTIEVVKFADSST